MTVRKESTIHRYIGASTDSKPTSIPAGSTFYEYDTALLYITYDGTNYAVKPAGGSSSGESFQVFTSSAATTTTITAAALADVASQYIGQMVLPLQGAMAGEGRYITAYNGTNQLTVSPAWASDPDAAGAIKFAVVSGALGFIPATLAVPTANDSTNAYERDVIGNKTDTAVTAVGTTASILAYIKGVLNQLVTAIAAPVAAFATLYGNANARVVTKTSTSNLTSGTLFNIVGSVQILSIIGRVSTAIQNSAQTVKLTSTCDSLAAVDLCAATTITNFAVKSLLWLTGTFADVMSGGGVTAINVVAANASPIVISTTTSGVISTVFGTSGSLTGAIVWEVLWIPLNATGSIAAA
jgi:roadblock/LC7 domain-containing protein